MVGFLWDGSVVEGDFLVGFPAFLDREGECGFAGGFKKRRLGRRVGSGWVEQSV